MSASAAPAHQSASNLPPCSYLSSATERLQRPSGAHRGASIHYRSAPRCIHPLPERTKAHPSTNGAHQGASVKYRSTSAAQWSASRRCTAPCQGPRALCLWKARLVWSLYCHAAPPGAKARHWVILNPRPAHRSVPQPKGFAIATACGLCGGATIWRCYRPKTSRRFPRRSQKPKQRRRPRASDPPRLPLPKGAATPCKHTFNSLGVAAIALAPWGP